MYPEDQSAARIQPISPEPWHRKNIRELWVHEHSISSFLNSNPWETQGSAIRKGTRAYWNQWKSFQLFQQVSGTSPWWIFCGCLLPTLCSSLTSKFIWALKSSMGRFGGICLSFHCKQQLTETEWRKEYKRGEMSHSKSQEAAALQARQYLLFPFACVPGSW